MGASKICTSACLKRLPLVWRSRFGKTALRADEAATRGAQRVSHHSMGERVLEHSSKRSFQPRCEERCAGSTRSAVEDATRGLLAADHLPPSGSNFSTFGRWGASPGGGSDLPPIDDAFGRPTGLCFNQHENLM